MTKNEARRRLKERGLVPTAARIAVLRLLVSSSSPMSVREIQLHFADSDWHRTTIFRSIETLRDSGLADLAGRRGDVETYSLATQSGLRRSPHLCRCAVAAPVEPVRAELARGAADSARPFSSSPCPVCHPG